MKKKRRGVREGKEREEGELIFQRKEKLPSTSIWS
jgi:hypothetical protein